MSVCSVRQWWFSGQYKYKDDKLFSMSVCSICQWWFSGQYKDDKLFSVSVCSICQWWFSGQYKDDKLFSISVCSICQWWFSGQYKYKDDKIIGLISLFVLYVSYGFLEGINVEMTTYEPTLSVCSVCQWRSSGEYKCRYDKI